MQSWFIFRNVFLVIITHFPGKQLDAYCLCILPFGQEMQFQMLWGLSSIMNVPKSRSSFFTSVSHKQRLDKWPSIAKRGLKGKAVLPREDLESQVSWVLSFLDANVKKWKLILSSASRPGTGQGRQTFSIQIFSSSMIWAETKKF